MKDGTVIKEIDEVPFRELDMHNVERFRITESPGNIAVPFSSDSGIIRFTNLDLRKLKQLKGGERLTFTFDKETGIFRLDKDSLDFYKSIQLEDNSVYYFIEFDQTGIFNINGQKLFTGFETSEDMIEFCNNPPYDNIIQYKNGISDIRMKGSTPINKTDKTLSYVIGYNKVHKHNDIEFDLQYKIIYDLMDKCVKLDFILKTTKDINGKIYIQYGNKYSKIPVNVRANNPMQTKRVLDIIG